MLLSLLLMTSLNVLLVVDVVLDVAVPFFSADIVVKDIVVERFCQQTFVEQLVGCNVVLDAVLPIVLLGVEHDVGVELCECHSLDVRSCCARCCCRNSFHILLSNLLSRSSSLMMLSLPMFCWTLRAPSMLSALSIFLLSGRVVQNVCLHIFVANFVLTNSSISSLLLLLFVVVLPGLMRLLLLSML